MASPDDRDQSHRIRADQVGEMLNEARSLIESLEGGVVTDPKTGERGLDVYGLLEWAKASKGDGFPRGGSLERGGASTVLDDEDRPMPPLSDPVGELVVSEDNSVRRSAADVKRGIRGAIDDLRMAVTALMKADKPMPKLHAEPGCRSCYRLDGHFSAVHKVKGNDTPLCHWCYDWNAVHQADPPLELLQLHVEGRRITTRVVQQVMGKPAARKGA